MKKKEIKMSIGLFYMLIGTLVVFLGVIIIGFMVAFKKTPTEVSQTQKQEQSQVVEQNITKETPNNTSENENIVVGSKEIALDVNSELVQNLYKNIFNDTFSIEYAPKTELSFYRNTKITNNTIEDDVKLFYALKALHNNKTYTVINNSELEDGEYGAKKLKIAGSYIYNDVTETYEYTDAHTENIWRDVIVFSLSDIQKKAKEMFNSEINIQKHTFTLLAGLLAYDNDTYKLFDIEGGGDYPYWDCSKLIRATQKDNEIYIFDNYARLTNGVDDEQVIYSSSESNSIIGRIPTITGPMDIIPYLQNKGITLPIYKHTFKQGNNGSYYWVSSELTNKNELKIIE